MLKKLDDSIAFRIERTIASGGMGSVYEARQVGAAGFEKRVAIKTILPEFSADRRFVDLFIQEAKLVADLVHENIVQIYQFGLSKDGYYIVMEYINGLPLAEFIRMHAATKETIPEELAVFIVSRIARGLAYAHARVDRHGAPMNIVHRDICPNNILMTTEGLPKLADFGIAKAATQVIRAKGGKKSYMSPEQAGSGRVDFRSDIYSLGLVLFELLARRSARALWTDQLAEAAREGRVDWLSLPPTVSPPVRAILERMLQLDPLRRYGATDQLAYDLEYAIYHKGYGPTVVTLENYLRQHFGGLYLVGTPPPRLSMAGDTIAIPTTLSEVSTEPPASG
jgi:serine/threonine protein kinase